MSVKIIKKSINDRSVTEVFQNLLGANGINLEVVLPKVVKIKQTIATISRQFNLLHIQPFCDANSKQEIKEWLALVKQTELPSTLGVVFDEFKQECTKNGIVDVLKVDTEDAGVKSLLVSYTKAVASKYKTEALMEMNDEYNAYKQNQVISSYIVLCRNLNDYKKFISNKNSLDYKFIEEINSPQFTPLVVSKFNFKRIYDNLSTAPVVKDFLINLLHELYVNSYILYKLITSPDVDVESFSAVILESIGELKKHIPRCDKAFKKIEDSLELLKGNFANYYKDFVVTKNPTTIIENFIVDVSKDNNTKNNIELARQFRQIVLYYRKASQNRPKNPDIDNLFNKLDENFKLIKGIDDDDTAVDGDSTSDNSANASQKSDVVGDNTKKLSKGQKKKAKSKRKKEEERLRQEHGDDYLSTVKTIDDCDTNVDGDDDNGDDDVDAVEATGDDKPATTDATVADVDALSDKAVDDSDNLLSGLTALLQQIESGTFGEQGDDGAGDDDDAERNDNANDNANDSDTDGIEEDYEDIGSDL